MSLRLVVVLTSFYGLIAPFASASCLPSSCYLISFRVTSCEYRSYTNRDEIEPMLKDGPAIWKSMIDTTQGAVIIVERTRVRAMKCAPHMEALELPESFPEKFFVNSENKEVCDELNAKEYRAFVMPRCCDTVPASSSCKTPQPLVKLERLKAEGQ